MEDRISVVMTTYNGEKYIEKQIMSIANQTKRPTEIIISDDCSSDKTVDIIKRIIQTSDLNICLIENKKNQGYIKNFRNTILKASGEYIFLCDQDDLWEPEKIAKTLYYMKERNALFACTGFQLIDGDDNLISDLESYKSSPIYGYKKWTKLVKTVMFKRLIWGNFSPGCTYCFRREILETYKKLKNIEVSHDFQILLIAANRQRAIYIDLPLSCYRLHENNTVGMSVKGKKRVRHFRPKLLAFLNELTRYERVNNLWYARIVLYCRLPMLRTMIIQSLHLENSINW